MAWPLTKIGPLKEEVEKYIPKRPKEEYNKYDPFDPYSNPYGLEILGGFYCSV